MRLRPGLRRCTVAVLCKSISSRTALPGSLDRVGSASIDNRLTKAPRRCVELARRIGIEPEPYILRSLTRRQLRLEVGLHESHQHPTAVRQLMDLVGISGAASVPTGDPTLLIKPSHSVEHKEQDGGVPCKKAAPRRLYRDGRNEVNYGINCGQKRVLTHSSTSVIRFLSRQRGPLGLLPQCSWIALDHADPDLPLNRRRPPLMPTRSISSPTAVDAVDSWSQPQSLS